MRFSKGVKWRAYRDGIVVYAPSTCETHILEPQFAAFFRSVASQRLNFENNGEANEMTSDAVAEAGMVESLVRELVSLKIIDLGN